MNPRLKPRHLSFESMESRRLLASFAGETPVETARGDVTDATVGVATTGNDAAQRRHAADRVA